MKELSHKEAEKFKEENPNGFILAIPKDELCQFVADNKSLTFNGMELKEGTLIEMTVFGETDTVKLFFDESKKMLMFKDNRFGCSFNILGYLQAITKATNVA